MKEYIEYVKNEDPRLKTKHFKVLHTWPQVHWIPRDTWSKTIVIKYRRDLGEVLEPLLEYLEIPWGGETLRPINVTAKKDQEELDPEDLEWIQDHYRDDFDLWDAVNTNPELFKRVI